MALLFFTGFNGIDDASLAGRLFVGGGTATVGAVGRFGQGVTLDADGEVGVGLLTAKTVLQVGASVRPVGAFAGGTAATLCYLNSSNAPSPNETLLIVQYRTDLETIELLGPEPGGASLWLGATGAYPIDTWYFIELGVIVSATAGTVVLKVDGLIVFSATGINTRGLSTTATIDGVGIGGAGAGPVLCDCLYVTDNAGGAPHNGFLDPCRADPVYTAADSSVDFTPLSSTNESMIDDGNSPDDDGTYNSSTTTGDLDRFTVAGYSAPGAEILGYCVRARAASTVADGRQLAALLNDGADDIGTPLVMTAAYTEAAHCVPESPTTFASAGAASTAINALLIGYTITT